MKTEQRGIHIVKTIIKISLKILFFFLLFDLVVLSYLLFKNRYRPVELTYLGCAEGKEGGSDFTPVAFLDFQYLACGLGYSVSDNLEDLVRSNVENPEEVNFEMTQKEGRMYLCSWHVPLERLEYTSEDNPIEGGHKNRATFFREEYQEGVCFFYEAEDIDPCSMVLEPQCVLDGQTEKICMYVILFLLAGTLGTGWLSFRKG